MPTTLNYCTEAEMKRRFSTYGITAYADHDEDGVSDTDVTDDSIIRATEEINLYAMQQYSEVGLASSRLIKRWCTDLAVFFHCELRGNPVPESLQREYDRIMAELERVRAGILQIPGLAKRGDLRPSFSNLTVDRRYPRSIIRNVRVTSSEIPSVVRQNNVVDPPTVNQ